MHDGDELAGMMGSRTCPTLGEGRVMRLISCLEAGLHAGIFWFTHKRNLRRAIEDSGSLIEVAQLSNIRCVCFMRINGIAILMERDIPSRVMGISRILQDREVDTQTTNPRIANGDSDSLFEFAWREKVSLHALGMLISPSILHAKGTVTIDGVKLCSCQKISSQPAPCMAVIPIWRRR